jgi:putative hydrolase of HD superfamily
LEKRHSWPLGLSGPKESVADHSYQLIVLVLIYHDKLDQQVNLLKCIYMAAIRDLPEAICGDIPLTDQTEKIRETN